MRLNHSHVIVLVGDIELLEAAREVEFLGTNVASYDVLGAKLLAQRPNKWYANLALTACN